MTTQAAERKLAAIMFTDMVGFSALTQRDEALALELLAEHQGLLRPIFVEHGGHEIKATGDGFLVEFASALQAVRCAIAIQTALIERNASAASNRCIELRIGLHLGDVEVRDGDVFGDGVNIAARIEPLAEPGGICVTGAVFEQIRNKINEPFVRLATPELKNIQVPIEAYRLVLPWTREVATPSEHAGSRKSLGVRVGMLILLVVAATPLFVWWKTARETDHESVTQPRGEVAGEKKAESDALTVPGFGGRPAIAVLPFDNLSGDATQEYFADGLAEDLITRLSLWRSFPVIARNSSFVYKGKAVDLKKVSADLGVRYVVEGSVRKAENRVRIAAQLIDATSGEHVWAETYDRELTDVFAVQDEISAAIAASVAGDLQRAEMVKAERRAPENLEAWGLYQRALALMYRFTREDSAKARALLERAVALDPQFSTALARLAELRLWDILYSWADAPERSIATALAEARRAVVLDPRDATAHADLAFALMMAGDAEEALEEVRRATGLNPSDPFALSYYANVLYSTGHPPEESIALIQRAMRLSPHDPSEWYFYDTLAGAYFMAGRYSEGLAAARRLTSLNPGYYWGYLYGAMNAVGLDHIEEARDLIQQARRIQPDLSIALTLQGLGAGGPDVKDRMSTALRQAGLE